jgi:hypothetical protein
VADKRYVVVANKPGARNKFYVLDRDTGDRLDQSPRKADCVSAARRRNERAEKALRREPRTIELKPRRKGTKGRRGR